MTEALPLAAFTALPGIWHKANPPFTRAQLADSERSPSWVEEYHAMTGIASDLAFGETTHGEIERRINAAFGVNIGSTNKTMMALVGQALDMLSVLRPDWYDHNGDLFAEAPEGTDLRSKNQIKVEEDAKLVADRKRKAAEAAAARRATERDTIAAALVAARAACVEAVSPIVTALIDKPFEEAKVMLTTQLAEALLGLGVTNPLATQIVYQALPEAWFKVMADGTLKLRESLPKVKPTGPNRQQRSFLKTLYAFHDKHGRGELIDTILLAWPGVCFVGADLASKDLILPDVAIVDEEEAVVNG